MATLPRLDRRLRPQLPSSNYPEKILQFGTGGFLRAFIGHFIEEANRVDNLCARIVAVATTPSGRDRTLTEQDGLYTLWVRGVQNGVTRNDFQLISCFSRALSATEEWQEVLRVARNPALEFIFSNTTEAGIALDDQDGLGDTPPPSFPAKLTRVLWERAQRFQFAREAGVVVLPCELIDDNGARLREYVLTLAERWQLDTRFARWIETAVPFCNTLVDRIVPGEPDREAQQQAWRQLGYRDELLTVAEPYRLFAIEASEAAAPRLSFIDADPAIIVADDIAPYRLRKVRLLNGAHTITAPLALLAGCTTVADAVGDPKVGVFLRQVLLNELVPSVAADGAAFFAHHVLERFANPFIRHQLIDITLQQTTKLRVRVIPSLLDYAEQFGAAPPFACVGFAAWLLYMRGDTHAGERRVDTCAEKLKQLWVSHPEPRALVDAVAGDEELWQTDLRAIPGLVGQVTESLELMLRDGVVAALDAQLADVVGHA
jgi:tagaturonate reductase